ncbi:MAG: helix-turn-helix transcriptional regulator [Clostridium sp.]
MELEVIRSLVGSITKEDLANVEYYISTNLAIFIPSVGFCKYAIKENHTHPTYSFVLFFNEEDSLVPAEIEIDKNSYLSVAMAPNLEHTEDEGDDFNRYIAIFIKAEFYEKYYKNYSDKLPETYNWKQFLVKKDIMIFINKFMNEYKDKVCGYKEILDGLALVITNEIIRGITKVDSEDKFISKKDSINSVIDYMQKNFGEKITIEILAKNINLSTSHFVRVFKREIGISPIEYLINLRVEKSKILLRSREHSITEVALMCGFNSVSHYSSCFMKHMRITPTEYQSLYT